MSGWRTEAVLPVSVLTNSQVSVSRCLLDSPSLLKARLSSLIAVTGYVGFMMAQPHQAWTGLAVLGIIFLWAGGAAALNNVQDRTIDQTMARTRERPLPAGRLQRRPALIMALACLGAAAVLTYLVEGSWQAVAIGVLAVVLYNGIYTPLKRKTILAIVPGAFCGMVPPLMGWVMAGGDILAINIWGLMWLLGLWQIPHFWLIVLHHAKDYRRHSIPNMLRLFSNGQLVRILWIWVLVVSMCIMMMPLWGVVTTDLACWFLLANASLLAGVFTIALFYQRRQTYGWLFAQLNTAVSLVLVVAMMERVLSL